MKPQVYHSFAQASDESALSFQRFSSYSIDAAALGRSWRVVDLLQQLPVGFKFPLCIDVGLGIQLGRVRAIEMIHRRFDLRLGRGAAELSMLKPF